MKVEHAFLSLKGKDLAKVITEVFSVIKLEKIVKQTSTKTYVCGNGCFSRDYNGTSSQIKNLGG